MVTKGLEFIIEEWFALSWNNTGLSLFLLGIASGWGVWRGYGKLNRQTADRIDRLKEIWCGVWRYYCRPYSQTISWGSRKGVFVHLHQNEDNGYGELLFSQIGPSRSKNESNLRVRRKVGTSWWVNRPGRILIGFEGATSVFDKASGLESSEEMITER